MNPHEDRDAGDASHHPVETSSPSRRADRITALVLIVLGVGVVVESWRMPRMTEFSTSVWSAPGVVPGMVGLLLAIMGAVLFLRGGGAGPVSTSGSNQLGGRRRVLTVFGLCILFAGVLVGRVPFTVAAFVFILGFVLIFDREDRAFDKGITSVTASRVVLALVVAAGSAFAITWVFETIFLVRLP